MSDDSTEEADHSGKSTADPQQEESTELEFEDRVELPGTKEAIWEEISDPDTLGMCLPGAEQVRRRSERLYTIELTRGIRNLTISLEGEFELEELNEPDWVLASGSAYDSRSHTDLDGLAAMEMTQLEPELVALDYRANVTFTGGVTSVPTRVLRKVIGRDVNNYFENVAQHVRDVR